MKKNYLDFIPTKNPEFREHIDENGLVVVVIDKHGFFDILAQKLRGTPKSTNIKLDKYGSFVWQFIDGNTSIFEIGKKVKEHFGEEAEPLYERLSKYFVILKDNNFINFKK